jgi:hypothetical protein
MGPTAAGLAALNEAEQRGYAGELLPLRLSLLIQAQNGRRRASWPRATCKPTRTTPPPSRK